MRKTSLLHLLKRLAFIAAMAYLGCVAMLFILQRDLLYRPFGFYSPPQELGLDMQELRLPTRDGQQALAWFSPPPEDASGKVVAYFHGNGGSLAYNRAMLEALQEERLGVLALEYRGYPGYEGHTTEEGIYHDARAAMDFLAAQGYTPEQVILLGQSLGSGVAVRMATEYDVALLALVSPFTSVTETAAGIYWYVPVRWLLRDRFDSLSHIHRVSAAVYIFHGTEDRLVPYAQGQRLYQHITLPKRFFALEGQGHNQLDLSRIAREIAAFSGMDALGENPVEPQS